MNFIRDELLLGSKSAELQLLELHGGQYTELCYSPIAVWMSCIRTIADTSEQTVAAVRYTLELVNGYHAEREPLFVPVTSGGR